MLFRSDQPAVMQPPDGVSGQEIGLCLRMAKQRGGIARMRRTFDAVRFGEIAKKHRWHGSKPQMGKGEGQNRCRHALGASRTGYHTKPRGVGGGKGQKALTRLDL